MLTNKCLQENECNLNRIEKNVQYWNCIMFLKPGIISDIIHYCGGLAWTHTKQDADNEIIYNGILSYYI